MMSVRSFPELNSVSEAGLEWKQQVFVVPTWLDLA